MESLFLVTGMVIGVVELVKRLFDRDFRAACIIAAAAAVGAAAGVFHVQGVDIATGIVIGLAGSGFVTIAAKVSKETA